MRRLAALVRPLVFAASVVACSDDSPTSSTQSETTIEVCGPGELGITNVAPTYGADPKATDANAEAAEAFRKHAIVSSSAAGGATRFVSGVALGVVECFARAIVTMWSDAAVHTYAGREQHTPIDCSTVYADSSQYTFDGGASVSPLRAGGSPAH